MSGHDTIGRDAIGRGETVSGETRLRDAGHGAVPGPATAFDEAKFGLFVHWGAYSVGGIEASWPVMLGPELQRRFIDALHRVGMTEVEMPERPITLERYEAFPGDFQAEGFDAAEWLDLVRDAGQRYLVFTTKHHDGFAMFDTDTTDYKITNSPLGRDVVGELAAAAAAADVGFGTYFSAPDFRDPGYRDLARPLPENFLGEPDRPEWAGFLDRMEAQVRELCTRYGDLFSWWWDIGFGPQWPLERFQGLVRDLQPNAFVNDRLGGLAAGLDARLRSDFLTPEQSIPSAIPRRSTFGGPTDPTMLFAIIQQDNWAELIDQIAPVLRAHFDAPADPTVPPFDDLLPWEACMTFGGQWAWNPDLQDFSTGAEVTTNLIEVASRGGNLLMNVGPRGDGTIQPEFQDALREVGRWLGHSGRSIYGTTFGPVQGVEGVRSTADADAVYLHVLGDEARRLELAADALPDGPARAIAADVPIDITIDGDVATIDLDRLPLDPAATAIEIRRR